MWVEAGVPVAGLSGSVSGTNIQGSVTGAGDSSYSLAMLLKGGPTLTVAQFEHYEPTTTLGVSLTITAPTGLYNPNKILNKILNLGSDRWSFKPEIALSHPTAQAPTPVLFCSWILFHLTAPATSSRSAQQRRQPRSKFHYLGPIASFAPFSGL
jgi:hypothetical protein